MMKKRTIFTAVGSLALAACVAGGASVSAISADAATALELGAEITAVEDQLVEGLKKSQWSGVQSAFAAIDMSTLEEPNETVTAQYDALKTTIQNHPFNYINTYGTATYAASDVEWTEKGLYYTDAGEYATRLNYNKPMNLQTGATVEFEITEAAYYTGSVANNLCINFLGNADSYKDASNGITLILFLFATESKLAVVQGANEVVSMSVPTPMDEQKVTLSIKYDTVFGITQEGEFGEYNAYVINFNGVEMELTPEVATQGGVNVVDTCYFSMGSFMDDRAVANKLTLMSVDGVDLGWKEASAPETPDEGGNETPDDGGNETPDDGGNETPDDGGNETPDDGGNETPDDSGNDTGNNNPMQPSNPTDDGTAGSEETGGCGSFAGVGVVAGLALAGAMFALKKRKE
ncbi:MAG: hypothetical protein IJ329_02445 [Clostridia bacterium]|nr:hypothetical protein [Clostridia bacterium]